MKNALASWRGGPSFDFVPYVVLTDARTGSTWFADLLRSHPRIVSFDELFHRLAIYGSRESEIHTRDPGAIAVREADPAGYLRDAVFAPREADVEAVGFKVFYRHFYRRTHHFRLPRALVSFPGIRIVSLYRRDLLEVLVSRTLAWGRQAGRDRIRLTPAECLWFFLAYRAQRKFWETYFSRRPLLRVAYEDVVSDQARTMNGVLRHLGCDERPLTSDITRADRKPAADIVENYDDLSRLFRWTRWAPLFP